MASAPSCRSLARLAVVAALLWLVFARLFLSPLIKSRAKHCLRLPVGRNVTRTSSAASFVLLWSTDASSFSLRSRRCVESILYHHPSAAVRVYSNQLPRTFFAAFRRAGFDIRVHRYNVTELLLDTPAAAWLERLAEWERGPYFYSHVTDAVRLAQEPCYCAGERRDNMPSSLVDHVRHEEQFEAGWCVGSLHGLCLRLLRTG